MPMPSIPNDTIQQYASLNDAAKKYPRLVGLAPGKTKVLYQRVELIHFDPDMVEGKDLQRTHVVVGEIAETDPDEVFRLMQGEFWSPRGEANYLVSGKGVHTSMSMGDVMILPDGRTLVVEGCGFRELEN